MTSSIAYCPSCGAEYVAGISECADCNVPLVGQAPGGERLGDDDVEEVVYELADWEPDLRVLLANTLTAQQIPFVWEVGGELVVREVDSERVEQILDDIEFPDALDADDEAPAGEETGYEAFSDLYDASDRLMHDPQSPDALDDMIRAAEGVLASAPPYGFAPQEWARIRGLAASVKQAILDDADDDVVAGEARALRQTLAPFV